MRKKPIKAMSKKPIKGDFPPGISKEKYCAAIDRLMEELGIECMWVIYGLQVSATHVAFHASGHSLNPKELEVFTIATGEAIKCLGGALSPATTIQ